MLNLLKRWAAIAASVWIATLIVPGITVDGGWTNYFLIAAVFALANLTVGRIVKIFTFPFILLSLGLGLLVINALMWWITDRLLDALAVNGVIPLMVGSILITIASSLIGRVGIGSSGNNRPTRQPRVTAEAD
jgi:putative membrane protein